MFDPTRQIGKCRQWFFNDWRATFPVFAMCDNYVYRVAFKLSIFVIARGYDREWAVNASAVRLSGLDNRFFAAFAILPSAKFPTHIYSAYTITFHIDVGQCKQKDPSLQT
ncbi:MAG: hypothetical protein BA874_00605 [Desulfuromonadales bacterium C00003068]|jgi:hypothetical protein|nr:MAG: hypothetical protein BA874_00605 [Desulfuromonadales bacterium C00003068]